MKKTKFFIFTVLALLMMNISVFAIEDVNNDNEMQYWYGENITIEKPLNDSTITTFGIWKPSENDTIDLNNEKMPFSGKADISSLYTNNHFTGKESVYYSITNNHTSKTLTVKRHRKGSLFASETITVAPGKTVTGNFNSLNKSGRYYLKFSAPCDFEGYVE